MGSFSHRTSIRRSSNRSSRAGSIVHGRLSSKESIRLSSKEGRSTLVDRKGTLTLPSDGCIKHLALFKDCDMKFVEEVATRVEVKVFQPGEVLRREDMPSESLWIINRGEVQVSRMGKPTGRLKDGASFGEDLLMGARQYSLETIYARTVVDTRILDRTSLREVLAHYPYERALFQQMAVRQKLAIMHTVSTDGNKAQAHEQRILEDEARRLDLFLKQGRDAVQKQSRGGATPNVPGNKEAAAGGSGRCRCVMVEEPTSGSRLTLADWHRQLAASREGRRLNVWQLDFYAEPGGPGDSLPPTAGPSSGRVSTQLEGSRLTAPASSLCPTREPTMPPRVPVYSRNSQRYPELPSSPPHDPSCVRGSSRPWSVCSTFGRAHSTTPTPRRHQDPLPPGLSEAMADLSQGVLRSRWSCEQHQARAGSGSPGPAPEPRELRAGAVSALGYFSATTSVNEMDGGVAEVAAAASDAQEGTGVLVPFGPRRRLEVTLRGTFRNLGTAEGDDATAAGEGDFLYIWDAAESRGGAGASGASPAPQVASVAAATPPPLHGARFRSPVGSQVQEQAAAFEAEERERMGFGKDEGGALPSGRSSVPAIRGGARSAPPPLPAKGADEGIELEGLAAHVAQHVRRILERGLRDEGPSRATSCEPPLVDGERGVSPPQLSYGGRSPSPRVLGAEEQLNLRIRLRLCQSRCGSSSAVLELTLDHHAGCSEARGCRCSPPPEEAEAWLLAYFARHSKLQLTSTMPSVRVFLEPLPAGEGEGDEDDNGSGAEDTPQRRCASPSRG